MNQLKVLLVLAILIATIPASLGEELQIGTSTSGSPTGPTPIDTSTPSVTPAPLPVGDLALAFDRQSPYSTFCITGCDIGIHADLNHDGYVNILDLSIVGRYWGTTSPIADVNGDGIVNLQDVAIIGLYWNQRFF